MKIKVAEKILEQTRGNYEVMAQDFSHTRAYLWSEFKEFINYVKDGDRVLDLGCGNGRLYELFGKSHVQYTGVDNSINLINLANQFKSKSKFSVPQFLVGDVLQPLFNKNEFNAVLSLAVLHHIPSKQFRQDFLANCYKYLKPGGYLILTVWNFWQPRLLWKYKIWPMIFGWRPRKMDYRDIMIPWKSRPDKTIWRYHHAFIQPELKRLVSSMDFKVIDCYYVQKGVRVKWFNGFNLVLIAQKQ